VRINTDLLTSREGDVQLNVTPDVHVNTSAASVKKSQSSLTWSAKPTDSLVSATLVITHNNVTGTIRTRDKLFAVRPLGDGLHVIVREDESKAPPEHPPEFQRREKEAPRDVRLPKAVRETDQSLVLSVLVAYTPKVKSAVADVDGLIALAIAETNQGYHNSQITLEAQLVHSYQVNYTESGSFDTDLDKFRGKNDGVMDEVHVKRDQYKADVCVLLIDNSQYCGLADAIMATEDHAFAVVYHHCATGYYSFAHEIGHLQGARHNLEADPTLTPFPYGHGYYYEAAHWRTIMSYECPAHCTRLNYWSNPNLQYGGVAMGTGDKNNNARVLNETAPIVTNFRH
jgi:hypothetical protein